MKYAIVYKNHIEWSGGEKADFDPGEKGPTFLKGLPEEAISLILRGPSVDMVFLAEPLQVNVYEQSARFVPLGQGENNWKALLRENWDVPIEELTARHFPLESAVLVVGTSKKRVQQLRKKRGVKFVYPLPLVVSWVAAQREPTIAIFLRGGFALMASGQDGKAIEIQTLREEEEILSRSLENEIQTMVSSAGFATLPKLILLSSSLPKNIHYEQIEFLDLSDLNIPSELGWELRRGEAALIAPLLYGSVGLLLGILPGIYLSHKAQEVRVAIDKLNQERNFLEEEIKATQPIKARIEAIQTFLKNISPDSTLFTELAKLGFVLPDGVLVSEFEINQKSLRLVIHAPRPELLDEGIKNLFSGQNTPKEMQVVRTKEGWYQASVSIDLTLPPSPSPKEAK